MYWKRRKLNDCNDHLLKFYKEVARIGTPQRVMFYKNGHWMNIPHNGLTLVKHDLQEKRFIVNIEDTSGRYALDFLNMLQIDLERGFQHPLGWVNEEGNFCLPKLQNNYESLKHFQLNEGMRSYDTVDNIKHVNQYEVEASGHNMKDNKLRVLNMTTNGFLNLDVDAVKTLFLRNINSLDILDIVDIQKCSGAYTQERFELFQKQVKITKEHRGDANVRYAWLASSKGAFSTILTYGIGYCKASTTNSIYGVGVHLIPVESFSTSVHCCDIDANGEGYMILCRIIMGTMELLGDGSEQSCPSSEDFDNGVDDLQEPNNYTIWDMNVNTHIYPEYIVRFKPNIEGLFVSKGKMHHTCKGTTSETPLDWLFKESSYIQMENDNNQSSNSPKSEGRSPIASGYSRTPRVPWMPFPVLIAAISNMVPSNHMDLVNYYFDQFKEKKLTKNDFVKQLKTIVGDDILKTTVYKLQFKVPSDVEPKARQCQK